MYCLNSTLYNNNNSDAASSSIQHAYEEEMVPVILLRHSYVLDYPGMRDSSLAQSLRELDAQFEATFPGSKNHKSVTVLTKRSWVERSLSLSRAEHKTIYPDPLPTYHQPTYTPADVGFAYDYSASPEPHYDYGDQSYRPSQHFVEHTCYDDHAKQRSSGNDPAGPAPECQHAAYVKSEPVDAEHFASPYITPVPPHMIVPSHQPFLDLEDEMRRRSQPLNEYPPRYLDQLPFVDGDTPFEFPPDSPRISSYSTLAPLDHQHMLSGALYQMPDSPPLTHQSPSPTPPRKHTHAHASKHQMSWHARRTPSPRPRSPPAAMRLSPLAKKPEKKPPLACLFCRGRKIACGPPLPGSTTCNQCERRQLVCEYPLESRRGMRKKKSSLNPAGPKVTVKASRKGH